MVFSFILFRKFQNKGFGKDFLLRIVAMA